MSEYNLFNGERIRLTAMAEQDAESLARWSEDAEYLRSLDTDYALPRSAEFFRESIKSTAADAKNLEFGIRLLEGDLLIGFVALHSIEWNNQAGMLAIGIGERDYRGKGYGTEAVRLLLRYAFDELNMNRVGLDVISNNKAAIRSYEKAGFVAEGATRQSVLRDGQKLNRIYMGVLREEWRGLSKDASPL